MTDLNQQVQEIEEYFSELISLISVNNEKEKTDITKSLARNSVIEKVLTKFLFQYKSKNYDIYYFLLFCISIADTDSNNTPFIKFLCRLNNDLKQNQSLVSINK